MKNLQFDKTVKCSITDDSKSEQGEYTVTDGSSTFKAYSESTKYSNGASVYVNIPNGDYNNKKLIILVTDGMPDNQCETTQIANQLKDKGIIIAAIASGSVDHEYLASLTTSKNYYFPIENMNSLESAFKTITDSLTVSN